MKPGAYLETAVERTALTEHVGKSGAGLERVLLADGRRLVVKRASPRTDLVMALSDSPISREFQLWSSGVLDQLPAGVAHAIVDAWVEDDVTVIVMRDLGDTVLTWDDRLSRDDCRLVLAGAGAMYVEFLGRPPPDLTPLPALLGMFAPHRLQPYTDSANPLASIALHGWEVFAKTVPSDVAVPVFALMEDPTPLADALTKRPTTLIHGDLATVNMSIADGSLTLLDWCLPAAAPAAVDLARFLAGCASVTDATREQIIEDFRELAGPAYDEVALRLALLGGLIWLGWNKAMDATEHPDSTIRERERRDLAWWLAESRKTLEAGLL